MLVRLTVLLVNVCVPVVDTRVPVTPLSDPSSVAVTAETPTLPDTSETNARDAVKSLAAMVVAPPVIVACFALSCVWIADVTPLT